MSAGVGAFKKKKKLWAFEGGTHEHMVPALLVQRLALSPAPPAAPAAIEDLRLVLLFQKFLLGTAATVNELKRTWADFGSPGEHVRVVGFIPQKGT